MRPTLFSPILRREGNITHFMSSTALMDTIGSSKPILNRIFSEGLTSIRFLRKWPGLSVSGALKRSSGSRMARESTPSNFKDQEFLAEGSFFSVLALEEAIDRRFQFPLRFCRESRGNSFVIFSRSPSG